MSSISIQTKKMGELQGVTTLSPTDLLIIHDGTGMKTCTVEELLAGLVVDIATTETAGLTKPNGETIRIKTDGTLVLGANGAGAHNSIY